VLRMLTTRRHRALLGICAMFALVASLSCIPLPTVAQPAGDPRERVLEIVAAREGVPVADLEIVAAAKSTYREQGLTLDSFKVYDRVRDKLHLVALDTRGQEVDPEAVARRDADLARQARGALDPAFAKTIDAAAPSDLFDVLILVAAPGRPAPAPTGPNVTKEQVDAFLASVAARRRIEVAAAVAPVIAMLQAKGVEPVALAGVPFLSARLSAADIRDLSRASEIVSITEQSRP
jgi:hypothetical protein